MKESIVIKVAQKPGKTGGFHSFETKHGVFWTWQVRFENQDVGEFNTKDNNQPKFILGESAHYTIEENEHDSSYPAKIKWQNPDYDNKPSQGQKEDPERQRLIIRQTCIKAAAEFFAHRTEDKYFFKHCDEMFDWVMKPESLEAKEIKEGIPDFLKDDDEPPF